MCKYARDVCVRVRVRVCAYMHGSVYVCMCLFMYLKELFRTCVPVCALLMVTLSFHAYFSPFDEPRLNPVIAVLGRVIVFWETCTIWSSSTWVSSGIPEMFQLIMCLYMVFSIQSV